ncbi:MAG: pre-peptidase C-terminal domain-containing protein [Hyphomonadaceae bacterium]
MAGLKRLLAALAMTALAATPSYAQSRATSVSFGRAVSGELRAGDATLRSGEFSDAYTFQGRAGQRVIISLQSNAFDPYIILIGPGGFQQDNDDDPNGGLNSRLDVTLPADGEYRIGATSFAAGSTGSYTLLVQDGSAAPQQAANLTNDGGRALAPEQSQNGALQVGDAQLRSGEFVDSYRFLGYRGQRVTIDMQSSQFDTYLILTAPNGEQQDNDDVSEGNVNSRIEVILPEDGEYGVHATSYQPGETGAYSLNISIADDSGRAIAEAPEAGGGLRLNRTTSGRLENGDQTLRSGEFADTYTFRGQAGQRISVDMSSSEIDSYLIVVSPSGEQQDNDDAGAGIRDSRVDLTLSESGDYRIVATSYAPGESGGYSLRVSSGGGGPVVAAPVPAPSGAPAAGGRAQVHGIFVGISDYSGYANSLPYTAEDAVNLAQTLRQQGVLSSDSVVLTDNQATRANVRNAFMRIAANAGPDDLFIFFFSGHGSQTDDQTGSQEADRREESIVLRDGEVGDDEMAQWFAAVRARVAIIALDSCFSGGFARDVVNRPGVMGLFSSEEDLTSQVASKFQAGGYLSHFLRTGLGGEADSNRNGVITAGELSTYLWRKFATEVEDVEATTREEQQSYQRLVVDRGGVKIDDALLLLR